MLHLLLMLAALVGGGPPASNAAAPCDGSVPHRYRHVVLIVMENHDFEQVASGSPYLDGLAAKCGLATNHINIVHPSLPNYIALTSGGKQGITDDCTSCSTGADSIFGQLGSRWTSYLEGMPSVGFTGATSGRYAKKHNPAAYYTAISGAYRTRAVPMGSPSAGRLAADLRSGDLAPYSLIIPDLCNDEHDCPLQTGDTWLSEWVPVLLRSPAYVSGDTLLVITYDETESGDGRIYTVVVAPSVRPGTRSAAPLTHYGLLRLAQTELGLPLLGEARNAPDPRAAFHL
jgi:phospholipase C